MSEKDIRAIVAHLLKTEKGREAIRVLDTWFAGGGLSLDAVNKRAVLDLVDAAWGNSPGTVREVLREAVES